MIRKILNNIVLFSCLTLLCGYSFAANWEAHGRLKTIFRYTPENWLQAGQEMGIAIGTWPVQGDTSLSLEMNGLWTSWENTPFYRWPSSFNTNVWDATLIMKGFLFKGLSPITIITGTARVNYSPYIMRADRSLGNPGRRGITISGLKWGKNNNEFNSFLLWDGSPTQLVYGGKAKLKWPNGEIVPIFVYYLDGNLFSSQEGIKKYDICDFEYAKEFDLKQTFSNGVNFKAMYATQEKKGQIPTDITELKLSFPLGQVEFLGGYRDFSKDFNPRYRDRTPKMDEQNRLTSWNPIDRYMGQKGVFFEIVGNERNGFIKMKYDSYNVILENSPEFTVKTLLETQRLWSNYKLAIDLGFAISKKPNRNGVIEASSQGKLMDVNLQRKLNSNTLVDLGYMIIISDAFSKTNHYQEYFINYHRSVTTFAFDLSVTKKSQDGYSKMVPQVGITASTPIGVSLKARYSPTNILEPQNREEWYDVFERRRIEDYDNIFEASAAFYF